MTGSGTGTTLSRLLDMCDPRRPVRRWIVAVAVAGIAVASAHAVDAAADPPFYRIFLRDGGTIVTYGEYAQVADRVVLSIPIGGTDEAPVLHVVSIAETDIEWERTNAYAQAARARRYVQTRGDADFAQLTREVADTLYRVGSVNDPAQRLAIAEAARRQLVEWPRTHYGYRAGELADMTVWLDQVVSELRIAAGQSSFDLALVSTPPPYVAPTIDLVPPPGERERLELALTAAGRAVDPAERVSLLRTVMDAAAPATAPGNGSGDAVWKSAVHARAYAQLGAELRMDRDYADLRSKALARAEVLQKQADVRSLQSLIRWVLEEDGKLNRMRPAEVAALLATLDLRLDAARRLRLARDAWALRAAVLRQYWNDVREGLDRLLAVRDWLTDVRELAGPSPGALRRLGEHAEDAQQRLAKISPPGEVGAAHSTLRAAAGMAARASATRVEAVRSGSMDLAWQASSAAAGALLMLDQAVADLRRLTHAPRPTR